MAANILSGRCDRPTAADVMLCDRYNPMRDGSGANLIKAAVLYEAYASSASTLAPGSTIAFVAGAANNATWTSGYLNTSASCKAFARLPKASHYGLVDFIPGVNNTQVL